MSELVGDVKEHKRRKMKLRRTQDLISQEVLSENGLTSARKPNKKPKRKRNDVFLPQVNDIFDLGIKASCPEPGPTQPTAGTSSKDFKMPIVDKRVKALKSTRKINCIGRSWLVESFTDVSSSADSTRENVEEVSRKKSCRKRNRDPIVEKPKPKTNSIQLTPCFVLLDKLNYDINTKVEEEGFKFLPSNSSSPFLRKTVGDLSLTKEMFEELPNWSKSDHWDVEDVVAKAKTEDGTKSIATVKIDRPSMNGNINLPISRKSLKNTSQTQLHKEDSILTQSHTATTKSIASEKWNAFGDQEGNQPLKDDTINLSTSNKSSKRNSTFEIEKPLDNSRSQSKRKDSILNSTFEKNQSVTKGTLDLERNQPLMDGTINLSSTSNKSSKRNSTFEIEKPLDNSRSQSKRKDSILNSTFEKNQSVKKGTLDLERNQPLMDGTINLSSSSNKSSKRNSTFEIEKPLDNSRSQSKRKDSILSSTFEKNQSLMNGTVDLSISKRNISWSQSKQKDSILSLTSEKNQSLSDGTINLSASNKSSKRNSTFEIEEPLDISRSESKRKDSILRKNQSLMDGTINLSTSIKSPKNNSTFEIEEPLDISRRRSKSSILSKSLKSSTTKPTASGRRKKFDESSSNLNGEQSSVDLAITKSDDTQQRQSTTMDENIADIEVLDPSKKPERRKWVILDESARSLSRQSFSESSANIFTKPAPLNKRRTIGEFPEKLERKKWSLSDKLTSSCLVRNSDFVQPALDEPSNLFVFGRKSSEAPPLTVETYSDVSFSTPEDNERVLDAGVTRRRRPTLTLDDTVTDIEVLQSACDSFGSPKPVEKRETRKRSRRGEDTTKKRRRVTFNEASVIIIDDSDELGTPLQHQLIPEDVENDSFTVTSTTSSRNDTPREPRRRISSESSLPTKSIGLNHKIHQSKDDFAIENRNLAPTSKSKLKKMPNFAKIHQKMYDKMPGLREYSEKKKERAKLLLSGNKQPKQPERIVPNVSKKQLFPSLGSTSGFTSNLVTSTPRVIKKPNGEFNQYGFKIKKLDQIKAVANKERPVRPPTRQRFKEELKGVRSNKRFDLLMKMRGQ